MSEPQDGLDFGDWYRDAHRQLVASLTLATGSVEEAAEAVDEALARALERWERVRSLDSPLAWVYRVALNVVRRRARRRQLELVFLRRQAPRQAIPPPAGEAWEIVSRLPDRQRSVVVLRYVAGLREVEIAAALGISRSTVSSSLADALRHLRRELEEPRTEVPNG